MFSMVLGKVKKALIAAVSTILSIGIVLFGVYLGVTREKARVENEWNELELKYNLQLYNDDYNDSFMYNVL